MNETELCEQLLNATIGYARTLSESICHSDTADYVFHTTSVLLNEEEKLESSADRSELTFYAPELVKECRSSFRKSNRVVIAHLEKFQRHGYHFEELIHALKLENQTLSEEIYFA
ncbi:MAG: hypothetical protein IJJ69_13145 [Oscillospiraceae bacterium]|nr:hypothetical protein [Oscillospiraceae bacterium]